LFFNPFSSLLTHGSYWAKSVEVVGTNFSKQDHIIIRKGNTKVNSYTREKTMPVNQTKFVSYRLTVVSEVGSTANLAILRIKGTLCVIYILQFTITRTAAASRLSFGGVMLANTRSLGTVLVSGSRKSSYSRCFVKCQPC
jgi:hypothetical protein